MMSWLWAIPERPPGHVRTVRRSLPVRRGLLANPSRLATIHPVSNNVTHYNTTVTGIVSGHYCGSKEWAIAQGGACATEFVMVVIAAAGTSSTLDD